MSPLHRCPECELLFNQKTNESVCADCGPDLTYRPKKGDKIVYTNLAANGGKESTYVFFSTRNRTLGRFAEANYIKIVRVIYASEMS
jgi:hypothetical protein